LPTARARAQQMVERSTTTPALVEPFLVPQREPTPDVSLERLRPKCRFRAPRTQPSGRILQVLRPERFPVRQTGRTGGTYPMPIARCRYLGSPIAAPGTPGRIRLARRYAMFRVRRRARIEEQCSKAAGSTIVRQRGVICRALPRLIGPPTWDDPLWIGQSIGQNRTHGR
jgi:hypothetical protein